MARVIIAHAPDSDNHLELACQEGEILELTGIEAPDGWLHAKGRNNYSGLVPEDYVELLEADNEEVGATTDSAADARPDDQQDRPSGTPREDDDGENGIDDGMRVCILDWIAEVGALNECSMRVGQRLQLSFDEDIIVPTGWVYGTNLNTQQSGFLPADFVGLPSNDSLSEDARELKKSREAERLLKEMLETQRLDHEKEVEAARQEKDLEIQKMKLQAEAEMERCREMGMELHALKTSAIEVLKDEVKLLEDRDAHREKIAWVEEQQRVAREEAESVYGGTRSVLGRKKALEVAQGERAKAELEFNRIDAARAKAERKLLDAQRKVDTCIEELHAEEAAREANERTLMLLPGLRELMAPTQDELKTCLESVTTAVMRNAEQSARLLANMAGAKPSGGSGLHGQHSPRSKSSLSSWLSVTAPNGLSPSVLDPAAVEPTAYMSAAGGAAVAMAAAPEVSAPEASAPPKLSLPERIRRSTAKAEAANRFSIRPQGVRRMDAQAQDSVFKGRYRSPMESTSDSGSVRKGSFQKPPTSRRHSGHPASAGRCSPDPNWLGPPPGMPSCTHDAACAPSLVFESATQAAQLPHSGTVTTQRHSCHTSSASRPATKQIYDQPSVAPVYSVHARKLSANEPALSIERQLQMGAALSSSHAKALKDQLRNAAAKIGDRPTPKAVKAVRSLVMAPDRRVGDRNDGAMALHVRRARDARDKAASKDARFKETGHPRFENHPGMAFT
eukprot:CAMPEP_0174719262 /NCGR_PEP_ID=MMETSP1094-20130205/30875_1 /TAXON_ID=156173 /ORGANISM="Chrysochromulina brevifilum, Strain UTEX LB 985" /LENGTH=733 /DNA_ID=CAMNT_0015919533 /DNA_START=102 /DNA_END=2303 /DNA_ORIENTATION=+